MSGDLGAARIVTGLAAVALPALHAAFEHAAGRPAWPTLVALVAGLATRHLLGAPAAVSAALVVAPVWPALAWRAGVASGFDQVVPWLGFLGAALAWPNRTGWQAHGLWAGAIASWALVVALVTPVAAARELDFTWLASTAPHLGGVVLLGGTAQLVALLLFDWYHGATERQRTVAWRSLIPGTTVAALVTLWQQQVDPEFLSSAPWTQLGRAAGTFFDANATAALLALTVPVLVSSQARPTAVPALWWGLGWSALAAAAIVATGSRSALTAFSLVVATAFARSGSVWRWVAVTTALGLAAWALATASPWVDTSAIQAFDRLGNTLRYALTRGSEGLWVVMWDRDGYGPAAMAMIADEPWVGTGPGLFGNLVPGYALETLGRALPPDNAQNWWRHHAAELGLLGALPAFACSLLAVVSFVRPAGGARVAPLAGVGLFALMSPPTPHPLIYAVVGLVVAHSVAPTGLSVPAPLRARDSAVVWALGLGCAALTLVTGWTDLRPANRAMRFGELYSYGVGALEPTPWGEGRWMTTRAVAVVQPTAPTLVARIVIPHDDAAAAPVQVTISTRDGVACRHEARDATPYECRMPAPTAGWMMVRVDVSRAWQTVGGVARAAVVRASFEP